MNLPITFKGSRILFAGIGGGFDIFTALPLWVSLRDNNEFVFSNYNATAKEFTKEPKLYPEKELKELLVKNSFEIPIYTIPKLGVKPQTLFYKKILEENRIDTIVAIDGGVDSLMFGEEQYGGTMLEDIVSLIAINNQTNVKKYLVCAGFGTELEENLCHYQALQNMSQIAKQGGFLGSCSLVVANEFAIYKSICDWVWSKGRKSHIQTKIISSVLGEFGDNLLYEGIEANVLGNNETKTYNSLLSSIYWFFDLDKVLQNNKLQYSIGDTSTWSDVVLQYRARLKELKLKEFKRIPL